MDIGGEYLLDCQTPIHEAFKVELSPTNQRTKPNQTKKKETNLTTDIYRSKCQTTQII